MDQAERLRQIIDNLKLKQAAAQAELLEKARGKSSRVITVTSGKGGVGKTNVTINLAIALSEQGYRVVILDADFGLANIDVLFGIIPKYTLLDVINGRKNILEILCEGPNHIKFISGGSGVEELVKLERKQVERFIENIMLLDRIADVILIDTGAGINDTVMSFVLAADEVLLVTTPEPTSITDAYALIKMVANRDNKKEIKVLVNRAESQAEADDIFAKLQLVADKFLSLQLTPIGYLLDDENVTRAVKKQSPFMLTYPKSNVSRLLREMSTKLISNPEPPGGDTPRGIKSFFNRLVGFLNG